MQSYLGNVWIFDLKTGKDDVHLLKYRVIPHSTTGAPSLFLSPTFKRFVHDDESGELTFTIIKEFRYVLYRYHKSNMYLLRK